MHAIGRLVQVDQARRDLDSNALAAVPILDLESVAVERHRHPVERVTVPGHRLAWGEAQPPDEGGAAPEERLVRHSRRQPRGSKVSAVTTGREAGAG